MFRSTFEFVKDFALVLFWSTFVAGVFTFTIGIIGSLVWGWSGTGILTVAVCIAIVGPIIYCIVQIREYRAAKANELARIQELARAEEARKRQELDAQIRQMEADMDNIFK